MVMRFLAWVCPRSRTPLWLDSRVLLGGTSRGRNSAPRLNRTQRSALPTILGGCLYVGAMHVRSADNPADAPSRLQQLLSTPMTPPLWVLFFRVGLFVLFDIELEADSLKSPYSSWFRLVAHALPFVRSGVHVSAEPVEETTAVLQANPRARRVQSGCAAPWDLLERWSKTRKVPLRMKDVDGRAAGVGRAGS
jgi:hypothetical protein